MGAGAEVETSHQNGVANGNGEAPPAAPPPEEPPKLEEIVTPDVLDAIIKGYKPEMKLVKFEAVPGTKPGDNYMSIMYAVNLELVDKNGKNEEKLEVMLKTIPRNIFRAEMINEMKAFHKETAVYQQVLPVLCETQKERGIPTSEIFTSWPICYAAHLDGTTDYLVMENLRSSGYKMGSRITGLDFNHCNAVLRNLGRFHAISFAKYGGDQAKIAETFPVLKDSMFSMEASKTTEMQKQWMIQSFKQQSDALVEMGATVAGSRLEKLSAGGADVTAILKDLLANGGEHAVVAHGDCWVNNMLFQYDPTDKNCTIPINIKFVDFQLSCATSRLIDVFYFLMTSGNMNVINEREQDLLLSYYTEFTTFAQKLGVDTKARGLTYDNFLKEVERCRFYGIILGLLLAPMLGADSADIPDMEGLTEEDFSGTEESMKKFFKDMTKGENPALKKAKILVMDHLPKCPQAAIFL